MFGIKTAFKNRSRLRTGLRSGSHVFSDTIDFELIPIMLECPNINDVSGELIQIWSTTLLGLMKTSHIALQLRNRERNRGLTQCPYLLNRPPFAHSDTILHLVLSENDRMYWNTRFLAGEKCFTSNWKCGNYAKYLIRATTFAYKSIKMG